MHIAGRSGFASNRAPHQRARGCRHGGRTGSNTTDSCLTRRGGGGDHSRRRRTGCSLGCLVIKRTGGQLENRHSLNQILRLLAQRTSGCSTFLHQRRVLLRRLIHLRHRLANLGHTLALLLAVLAFKSCVNGLGVARADIEAGRVRVTWADGQKSVQPQDIVRLVMAHRDRIRLQPPATLEASLDTSLPPAERLDEMRRLLESLRSVPA